MRKPSPSQVYEDMTHICAHMEMVVKHAGHGGVQMPVVLSQELSENGGTVTLELPITIYTLLSVKQILITMHREYSSQMKLTT
jgi:hypothetical protein